LYKLGFCYNITQYLRLTIQPTTRYLTGTRMKLIGKLIQLINLKCESQIFSVEIHQTIVLQLTLER